MSVWVQTPRARIFLSVTPTLNFRWVILDKSNILRIMIQAGCKKWPCHFESPYLKNYLCDLFLDGTIGKSTIEIYWYMKRSWIITLGFSYDRRFRTNYFFEYAFLVSMWVSDGWLGYHELWWGWIDFRGTQRSSNARTFISNQQNFQQKWYLQD